MAVYQTQVVPKQTSSSGSSYSFGSVSSPVDATRAKLNNAESLARRFGNINYDQDKIQGIFNQASEAEFNTKRKEYDRTANQYYGNLATSQNAYLDAMRKSYAQNAVQSGANAGMQNATTLSSLLGQQQQTGADALALAQQKRALEDKYAEAIAGNTERAMTYADQQRVNLANIAIQEQANNAQQYAAELGHNAQLSAAAAEANATAYAADQALTGTQYNADANERGQRYTADQNLTGTKYASDNNLAGTKYNADQNLSGTRYSADQNLTGTKYSADKNYAGTKYSADKAYAGARAAASAARSAAASNAAATKYTADKQYDAAIHTNYTNERMNYVNAIFGR